MYWKDHAPLHFHAIYSGKEAQVRIDDGRVLAGFLPATAERLVNEWAVVRRARTPDELGTGAKAGLPRTDRTAQVEFARVLVGPDCRSGAPWRVSTSAHVFGWTRQRT
ncbi:MAG: DUF4160 domain-containing protein [Actinomycetota bacterium]|nr:DUF4160 domain-containing protein [Actinomycetota bacterium]